MAAKADRQLHLLAGQSSLARKVFEVVPIQEAWPLGVIISTLHASGTSSAGYRAVQACIGELKEHGLVREPKSGNYQRDAILKTEKEPVVAKESKSIVVGIRPQVPADAPTLDTLAQLATEVTEFAEEVSNRLLDLATRIEAAALQVETERTANAGAANKLKRLQEALKDAVDE